MNDFSHFELKKLRKSLGASLLKMADLLGLEGNNRADCVREMENGNRSISGPIKKVATYLQEGISIESMDKLLPVYIICTDLQEAEVKEEVLIMRTRFPRFFAIIHDGNINTSKEIISYSKDGIERLSVTMWIDQPLDDMQAFALAKEAYDIYDTSI